MICNKLAKIKMTAFFKPNYIIIVTIIENYVHSSPIKRTSFFHITPLGLLIFLLAGSMWFPKDTAWWDHIFGQIYLRRQEATKRLKLTDLPGAKAERPKVEAPSQMKGPMLETWHFCSPKLNGWNLKITPQNEKEHQGVYPPVFFGFHLSVRGCN